MSVDEQQRGRMSKKAQDLVRDMNECVQSCTCLSLHSLHRPRLKVACAMNGHSQSN